MLLQAGQQLAVLAAAGTESEVVSVAAQESNETAPSSWLLMAIWVQMLRVVVQGYWTQARRRPCLTKLPRFVCGSLSLRGYQESTIGK